MKDPETDAANLCPWPNCIEITSAGFCDPHFALWSAGADPSADVPSLERPAALGAWRHYLASKIAICQRRQWRSSPKGQAERKRQDAERRRQYVRLNYDREKDRWRRKAHTRRTLGIIPPGCLWTLLVQQGYRCAGCRAEFQGGVKPTLDHKVPVSAGGTNDPSNLQVLCRTCNSTKAAKPESEWRRSAFGQLL